MERLADRSVRAGCAIDQPPSSFRPQSAEQALSPMLGPRPPQARARGARGRESPRPPRASRRGDPPARRESPSPGAASLGRRVWAESQSSGRGIGTRPAPLWTKAPQWTEVVSKECFGLPSPSLGTGLRSSDPRSSAWVSEAPPEEKCPVPARSSGSTWCSRRLRSSPIETPRERGFCYRE